VTILQCCLNHGGSDLAITVLHAYPLMPTLCMRFCVHQVLTAR